MRPLVIVVAGPTATGKSSLAIRAAQKLDGEVVSADSMQLYKGMDIGTAKVTEEQAQGVAHHMIDVCEPDEPYSVAQYQKEALGCLDGILARGKVPVLAGGSGLHINSITHEMDLDAPPPNEEFRASVAGVDSAELHRMLSIEDADAAARVHPNNRPRVVRALEIARLGGAGRAYDFDRQSSKYDFLLFGLGMRRDMLYAGIDARVDEMLSLGLVQEAASLFDRYPHSRVLSQAIGYKELVPHLHGEEPLANAAVRIKANTRHFAKRQLTWFRREGRMVWLDAQKPDEALDTIVQAALARMQA